MTTGQLVTPAPDHAAHRSWREGARAGLLATAAGALWSFVIDLAYGHPFETWTFLGSAFLSVLRPAETSRPLVAVIVFLAFVAVVFMLLGRLAVSVAHRADAQPSLMLFATTIVTLVTLALIAWATAFMTSSRLGLESWLQILGSPLIALWTLAFRVYRTHPAIAVDFRRADDDRADGG
jgi:FtsH-binding integral membrane protein